MAIIGIDLGGTKIAAGLFIEYGEMKKKVVRLLNGATGQEVGTLIVEVIKELQLYEQYEVVTAVGILKKRNSMGSKHPRMG